MYPGLYGFQIAEMRRKDFLVEAERLHLAAQAEPPATASRTPLPVIARTARNARYLVSCLASVAFAMTIN
jgi:hypothetical protein